MEEYRCIESQTGEIFLKMNRMPHPREINRALRMTFPDAKTVVYEVQKLTSNGWERIINEH